MDKTIDDIIELLMQSYGIDISAYDSSFLHKSLTDKSSGSADFSLPDYFNLIQRDRNEAVNFASSLHIGHSEFFRNPLTFSFLEQFVLPQIWSQKKKMKETGIRIWSAACASGQEPYSLAILLDEMAGTLNEKPPITIFATDNNESELERARLGIYDERALGKVSLRRVRNYFTRLGDQYKISPTLRQYVDFSHFDLLSASHACPAASIYGNFDLVFCSNLLFYYKPERRWAILDKIGKTMAPGAFLVTGETERGILKKHHFQEVFENSAIFKNISQNL